MTLKSWILYKLNAVPEKEYRETLHLTFKFQNKYMQEFRRLLKLQRFYRNLRSRYKLLRRELQILKHEHKLLTASVARLKYEGEVKDTLLEGWVAKKHNNPAGFWTGNDSDT